MKRLEYLNNGNITSGDWVKMVLNDNINLNEISHDGKLEFKAYIHNPRRYELKIRNYLLEIYE